MKEYIGGVCMFMMCINLFGQAGGCDTPLLPGVVRCFKYYSETKSMLNNGNLQPNLSADDCAKLWDNCFIYRDKEAAARIANLVAAQSKFWSGMFALLSGENVSRAMLLKSVKNDDVPSSSYAIIFGMLFTPDQLRMAKPEPLTHIADRIEKELAYGKSSYPLSGAQSGSQPGQVTTTEPLMRGFGALDYAALTAIKEKILSGEVKGTALQDLALASYYACDYNLAKACYKALRARILAVPRESRLTEATGVDFVLLAYLDGAGITQVGVPKGWLLVDGMEIPLHSSSGPREAAQAQTSRILELCAERRALGIRGTQIRGTQYRFQGRRHPSRLAFRAE